MFQKILIANRGEIAVRVARTARKLGIKTVAVFSDADAGAPHVRACDEAVHIGPAPAAESYLRIDKIIEAAKSTGAQAIHPGYGFLSENAEFADALEEAGIVFIGPTAETIRAMGSKSAAKDLMEAANVPTTPGYQGEDQSVDTFKTEAERIGYPVLLKATAGGGGKGMRMVAKASELAEALQSAQREAQSAFGDDRFLIEKYVTRARHLEVQIFGDGKGNVVHMYERDCSVQRRHQKVIEEAPAPNLPANVRKALLKAGVEAGKAVNYRGAGTVEFLYDGEEGVYFMEMNTRLQVEHPVSEKITGHDFVEWQLRVAAGEGLPLTQKEITETGHAFEARLYAEAPNNNFAPSIGTLSGLRLPDDIARMDSGVEEGQEITPFYDPMIAKIITDGKTREEALGTLRQALEQTRVAGLETNATFLHALADHPSFISGDVSTRFIEDYEDVLFDQLEPGPIAWATTALWHINQNVSTSNDPWDSLKGLRSNKPAAQLIWIEQNDHPALLRIERDGETFNATLTPDASAEARRDGRDLAGPVVFSFSGSITENGDVRLTMDGKSFTTSALPHVNGLRVWHGAKHTDIAFPNPLLGQGSSEAAGGRLTAPMPGVVTMIVAKEGDTVEAGAPLLVMEAMKMEHTISAPYDGVVKSFNFQAGDQVSDGDVLVDLEES